MMSEKGIGKIQIIGLDGAAYDMINFWMDRGDMPNLKKLMEEGVSGNVDSSVPPMTAPAWNNWCTGCNPGKHGIYDFQAVTKRPGRYKMVNSGTRHRKSIWDYLSEAGKKVTIQNMPTTYPPLKVNGVMISGMLTPGNKGNFGKPRQLFKEIEEKFGPYPLHFKSPMFVLNLNEDLVNTFIDETIQHLTYKFNVFNYLQDRVKPDFSFMHEFGNDQISHALWHVIEPEMGDYDPELIKRLREKTSSYYRLFDNYLGILMERLQPEDTLMIMSDHGFGRWHKTIAINTWLLRNGFIALKDSFISKVRHKMWKSGLTHAWLFKHVVQRLARWGLSPEQRPIGEEFYRMQSRKDLLLTVQDIDWSKTKAFSTTGWGQIYINKKGKFVNGAVKTKQESDQVFKEIWDALEKIKDPDSGFIKPKIWDKHDLYKGEDLEWAADITFSALDKGYLATNLYGFITNEPVGERWVFTGTHRQKGVIIGKGPAFKEQKRGIEMTLMDFLPNVLYMFGIPIPKDIDGQVVKDLYREEYLSSHTPEYKGTSKPDKKGLKKVFSKKDQEDIEDTLKGLGYL